jgi:hypothetical protein
MKSILISTIAAIAAILPAFSQTAGGFKFDRVSTLAAPLPGSEKPWIKVIAPFETSSEWLDGLAFNFYVIVETSGGNDKRLLVGSIAYSNIPAGKHSAIMYLPPGVVKRFGKPTAVKVECFRSDEQLGATTLDGPDRDDQRFVQGDLRMSDGMLLPVRSTPWLLLDFDKTPDIFSPY